MVKSKKKNQVKLTVKNNKIIKNPFIITKNKVDLFLNRRPHRSFRRTMRRDYSRSLDLPSYIAFTIYVIKTIWSHRKTFATLVFLSAIVTSLMVGIASQDTYSIVKDTINTTSGDLFSSGLGEIGKAGLLFITSATGGISQNFTEVQQVYAGLITLITWMTSIWLLRNILAGHKVKMRDGLYNAGSPIVSTFIIALVFVVQLLPLALALIGYGAASTTGLLAGGVEAMLFWLAASLLAMVSLYWTTSTFFALIIVTLPGMYPFKALRAAGDLVVGRRLRILLRLLWMIVTTILVWSILMIPAILIDTWLKGLWPATVWIPTVPLLLLFLSSATIVWASSYIYLLYRKVVADDANPS